MSGDWGQRQRGPAGESLTATELATELGVTEEEILSWIDEGKDIPHFQLGPRTFRFRRCEIAPLLEEHGGAGGAGR